MSAPSVYAECFAWEAPPGGAAVLEQAVPFQASADVGEAVPTLCGPPGGGVTLRGSACARSRLLTWRASGCCLELSELSLGEQPGFEQQAAADCGLRLCFSAPLLGGALATLCAIDAVGRSACLSSPPVVLVARAPAGFPVWNTARGSSARMQAHLTDFGVSWGTPGGAGVGYSYDYQF